MSWVRAVGILSVVALCLGGCATTAFRDGRLISDADLATNPFDTITNRPDILLTARLAGHMVFDGKCVVVETANGPITPLWPEGSRVVTTGDRQAINLPDGRGSVVLGRKVSLSGSAYSSSDANLSAPKTRAGCPPTYFAVSTAR